MTKSYQTQYVHRVTLIQCRVFQIELYDLVINYFLQSKVNLSPKEFWKLRLWKKFPTL